MTIQVTIDGEHIHDIESFYEEINRVFMAEEDWKLGASLDAFDDLLYGGYGIAKEAKKVELIWKNAEKSRLGLGYAITKAYYEQKLQPGSSYNKALFQEKLQDLEGGHGQTYFDLLVTIIAEHTNITLVLA
ncbi:barstar family protein [Siphonobacter sp. SORGH_AS_1065]|uniref:barstar family protein n=1 Tax=Siphonobacter sp. SORGH_AS_1065 TaxID=3041795 RepID=UPI0027884BE1|nr:barstar family protein [Siphonobacter sp. SORGH_AS_1065]MDQ1090060.1 RNAse (barnase) inhibitor barstar [Siphonobacter sp. SORGH_AS_1065]